MMTIGGIGRDLTLPEPIAARLWAGTVTTERIWERCHRALRLMLASRGEDDDAVPVAVDTRLDNDWIARVERAGIAPEDRRWCHATQVTGYDRQQGAGFAPNDHPDIATIGMCPARELLGLGGGAWLEHAGRWRARRAPSIPRIEGVALRDRYDLEQHILVAPDLICAYEQVTDYRGVLGW
jgi:hypothetical protein